MNLNVKNNILVTLKIISKIEKNDKIFIDTYNNSIQIEKYYYFQSIFRYFKNQSRIITINFLNEFYNKLENIIHNIFNQKHMKTTTCDNHNLLNNKNDLLFYFNDKNNLSNIKQELDKCAIGLNNLKETYSNDYNITLNLNIIIERNNDLSIHIKDNLEELKSYYSSISKNHSVK